MPGVPDCTDLEKSLHTCAGLVHEHHRGAAHERDRHRQLAPVAARVRLTRPVGNMMKFAVLFVLQHDESVHSLWGVCRGTGSLHDQQEARTGSLRHLKERRPNHNAIAVRTCLQTRRGPGGAAGGPRGARCGAAAAPAAAHTSAAPPALQ